MSNRQYTIGRNPDNQIRLVQPQVSGRHATLTLISDNIMVLEDHNSTNGTTVNGLRIQRMLITPKDTVSLGGVVVNFEKIFARNRQPEPQPLPGKQQNEAIADAFNQLSEVYEAYRTAKLQLQGKGQRVSSAVRAGLSLIPFVGSAFGILVSGSINTREKEFALNEEFQINYVCPKCKRFLGFLPWKNLANQKRCVACKAIWIID